MLTRTIMGPEDEVPAPEEWAAKQIEQAKRFLEQDGYAAPVCLFLAPHPGEQGIVVQYAFLLTEFFSAESREESHQKKNVLAEVIGVLLERSRAFAVLMITEAWMLRLDEDRSVDEALQEVENAGGVANLPERVEVLTTLFETTTTQDGRAWPILRDGGGNPRVGAEEKILKAQGRFGSFLRPPTTLH